MTQASNTLISLLLPEVFWIISELTEVDEDSSGLHIYLEENNIEPAGYNKADLESKGFFPEISI